MTIEQTVRLICFVDSEAGMLIDGRLLLNHTGWCMVSTLSAFLSGGVGNIADGSVSRLLQLACLLLLLLQLASLQLPCLH